MTLTSCNSVNNTDDFTSCDFGRERLSSVSLPTVSTTAKEVASRVARMRRPKSNKTAELLSLSSQDSDDMYVNADAKLAALLLLESSKDKSSLINVPASDEKSVDNHLIPIQTGSKSLFSKFSVCARFTGIFAAVLSAFFTAVNFAMSEYLEEKYDPIEVFAWRQTFLIFYSLPVAAYYQKPMYFGPSQAKLWWPMTLRSIGSSFVILFVYQAIEYIPLSDATVVASSAPVFCSIFARIFLKEKFGIPELLCALTVICGVTINARPAWLFDLSLLTDDVQNRLIGLAFALGSAISTALATVIMRKMKNIHFSTQQLMYGYISSVLTWPFVFLFGAARWPPCGLGQKSVFLAIGFSALPAQSLLIYACQHEKAGIVSIGRSTMPVFALIFQLTFFRVFPDWYSIGGNLIILGAIVGLALTKLRKHKSTIKHTENDTPISRLHLIRRFFDRVRRRSIANDSLIGRGVETANVDTENVTEEQPENANVKYSPNSTITSTISFSNHPLLKHSDGRLPQLGPGQISVGRNFIGSHWTGGTVD